MHAHRHDQSWSRGRVRRLVSLLAAAAVQAALPGRTLGAQIISVREHSDPRLFVSGSIGWMRLTSIDDGSSASSWDFGSGVQYRGTLEYGVGRQSTLGIAASWSRPPLSYYDNAGCFSGCDAHASVWFTGVVFHIGGSEGAYQVIDATVGLMGYSHFSRDGGTGGPIGPSGTDTDFSFGVGYGIGYGFSRNAQMQLVGDYQTSLHQHTGLPGGANTTNEQYTVRVGLRYGTGARRRGL